MWWSRARPGDGLYFAAQDAVAAKEELVQRDHMLQMSLESNWALVEQMSNAHGGSASMEEEEAIPARKLWILNRYGSSKE